MNKIGIIGASGYSGLELLRFLATRKDIKISFVTSTTYEGKPVSEVYPSLAGVYTNLTFTAFESKKCSLADIVFTALPHGASMEVINDIDLEETKVIDLSGDFRLPAATYEKWYKKDHVATDLIDKAVYGLTEFERDKIKDATLLSNPGCFPTSVILGIAPLLLRGAIETEIIVNSLSGISGAGRTPSPATHYCQVEDNVSAYKVGGVHQHIPEIEEGLLKSGDVKTNVSFTPHLVPMARGIYSTIYIRPKNDLSVKDLHQILVNRYEEETFVTVLPINSVPQVKSVTGTNFCHIGVALDERTGVGTIFSCIDNLGKGAAGQAIQNMNLMLGLEEDLGLIGTGLYP